MKLRLHVNGKALSADFTAATGQAALTTAAARHEAAFSEPQPGFFTVILNGKVLACAWETLPNGATEVIVNGQRIPVTIQDPKRLSHNGAAAGQAGGRAVLTSPMPGKVVRVLCAAGDEVAEGQGLLVVEAMKMQNEVQAPKAGQVVEIKVTEGQTVNAGEVLAVVE
jgi:biotin carboxyl carrier protein